MKRVFIYFIISFLVFQSCGKKEISDKNVVAVVGDKLLRKEDIKKQLPNQYFDNDSVTRIKNFIDTWIIQQLLLEKAEANLSDEEKDFTTEINNYRSSLIIYRYKQKFIKQKLDTSVSEVELMEYYKLYSSKVKLKEDLVKGRIIKVLKATMDSKAYRAVVKYNNSTKKEDQQKFEDFCNKNCETWDVSEWTGVVDFIKPYKRIKVRNLVRSGLGKYQCFWAKGEIYWARLDDFAAKGGKAPIEWIREKVREIIINIRRKVLFTELNENLVDRAKKIGHVKIK